MSRTEFDDLMREIDRWLERDVQPVVLDFEHADEYPTHLVEQMRQFGLFGATVPDKFGGMGLAAAEYSQLVARISEVWMSLSGVLNSHLMMAHLIERFGTEEQKEYFLPRQSAGELRGGLALSEPDCGSDLQAIRTQARREGETYRIQGTKLWITNARYGNCLAVLVRTDPEPEARARGLSVFLVEKSDGYEPGEKIPKLGYRGVDTTEVGFQDVAVPASRMLGEQGAGLRLILGALELGRINVASRGVGVARAALNEALKYSALRESMGKPIGQHQAIALKLADMACRVASAEALTRQAAERFDCGERCDLEAGMAKLVASEAALDNATEVMRIHGAHGYSTEAHVERYYRDAPLLCIGEGTNEIQRVVIARRLLETVGDAS